MNKSYIGIREARISFSKLIRAVRSGQEFVITDRGKPVARLVPDQGKPLTLEERIKNYESSGLIETSGEQDRPVSGPIKLPPDYVRRCIREEREQDE